MPENSASSSAPHEAAAAILPYASMRLRERTFPEKIRRSRFAVGFLILLQGVLFLSWAVVIPILDFLRNTPQLRMASAVSFWLLILVTLVLMIAMSLWAMLLHKGFAGSMLGFLGLIPGLNLLIGAILFYQTSAVIRELSLDRDVHLEAGDVNH